MRRHPSALALLVLLMHGGARAEPPRVLSTSPKHGDALVDQSLSEIRVEFDQDMQPGMSLANQGPAPESAGMPRWETPRIIVFPVRLQPGQHYRLSINSALHTNFRNLANEPAAPVPLWFRTTSEDDADNPVVAKLSPDVNRKAVAELRRLIDQEYSYRDLRVKDWDALFEQHNEALLNATTPYEFGIRAGQLLGHTEDVHIRVIAEEIEFPVTSRTVDANYNLRAIGAKLQDFQQRSKMVFTGRPAPDIAYICIASWAPANMNAIAGAFDALHDFKDVEKFIIDVRPNGGGSEIIARRFAGAFVREKTEYAQHIMRDHTRPNGFSAPTTRMFSPTLDLPAIEARVVVLMGPRNMSSCEAFLLMMRQVPDCTLLGAPSYGSSGNPAAHELGIGITVWLPQWQAMDIHGVVFEGVGLAPDIEVDPPASAFANSDPVFEQAIELLTHD